MRKILALAFCLLGVSAEAQVWIQPPGGSGGGGGGTPGGLDTECQYNDGGSFGGTAGCTVSGATVTMTGFIIASTTVASLPAAGTAGRIYIVTDANPAGSCTVGSGSGLSMCRDSGAAWVPVGDGGSGAGADVGLTNLSGVAVNTTLVSDTANTDSLGSLTVPWLGAFMGTGGVTFEGATADTNETVVVATDPTADNTITLPNASGGASIVLCKDSTDHATAGTSEESLYSCSIPAASLGSDGQSVRVTVALSFAANGNGKRIIVKFGATETFNSQVSSNGGSGRVIGEIMRSGASTQKANFMSFRGTNQQATAYTTPGETLSGAVTLDIRATTPSASGDLTVNYVIVELLP